MNDGSPRPRKRRRGLQLPTPPDSQPYTYTPPPSSEANVEGNDVQVETNHDALPRTPASCASGKAERQEIGGEPESRPESSQNSTEICFGMVSARRWSPILPTIVMEYKIGTDKWSRRSKTSMKILSSSQAAARQLSQSLSHSPSRTS